MRKCFILRFEKITLAVEKTVAKLNNITMFWIGRWELVRSKFLYVFASEFQITPSTLIENSYAIAGKRHRSI